MRKENVSYELIIDLISNIVKKYIDNKEELTKEKEKHE